MVTYLLTMRLGLRRLCAPKGDEEGDGEVGHETVVDAQGRISLSDGLCNAGQGGVHARRAAR